MVADRQSMIIYFSCFFISALMGELYQKIYGDSAKSGIKVIWTNIIILAPTIVAGARFRVGADYMNYLRHFIDAKRMTISAVPFLKSPIYYMIIWLATRFMQPKFVFGVLAYLTLFVLVWALMIWGRKIRLSYVLLLYFICFYAFTLNGVRQGLALSIVVLASTHLVCQNYKQYLFWTLVAISVHNSASVILFFSILTYRRTNVVVQTKLKYFCAHDVVLYAIALMTPIFVNVLYEIVYLVVANVSIFSKYKPYFSKYYSIGFGIMLYAFILLFILIINYDIEDEVYRKLLNISFSFIVFGYIGYFGYTMYRVRYYAYIMIIIAIGYMINKIAQRSKFVSSIVSVYYLAVFFYHDFYLETMFAMDIFPYRVWHLH